MTMKHEGHALVEFWETLAAAEDLGTCPWWCIGADHPEHDPWSAMPSGRENNPDFIRHHSSTVMDAPVGVWVEQSELRHNGEDTLSSPTIKCLSTPDDEFSQTDAWQVGSAFLQASSLLEKIQQRS